MRPAVLLRRVAALAFAIVAGAACATDSSTGVAPGAAGEPRLPLVGGSGSTLLQCEPPAAAQTVTGVIGLPGGTLQVGGTRMVIPENAVPTPTTFTLTVPRSPFVEISVRAGDAEHYLFQRPVLVTIDYGRCAGSLDPVRPVTAWHIDEGSRSLLENMRGLDVRLTRSITFSTGHLSGYAVAD
ncbi:MAG: hypothetical protein JWL60_2364 [Gemmatimonadetes bacterium]|jgi:hypothetical protein|nr:hypothetical protein [Gemmatimonadota bacterium]